MDLENERLWKFLGGIQLEQFYEELNQKLHVTRLEHLEHVVESDLLQVHMTMPEIRRLFDNLKKIRRKNFIAKLRRSLGLGSSTEITHKPLPRVASIDQPHSKGTDQNLRCLIHESNIVLKDVIGKGAFGYVQSADWIKDNGEKASVAVKCLQRKGNNSILAAVETELIKEANAMSNLNHPNLIRLFGVVLSSKMMLVTELAPLGALLKRLRQEPKKFFISTLCSFVIQIAAGMKYLESHRFVHRDLAARNILLMSYEKIKIGDFGLARPLPDDTEYYVMQPDGLIPFAWCAPECLKFRKFSHASDMWAFGVTCVELFTYGAEPWAGCNGAQILERIDKPNYERPARPDHCPANIFAIIQDLCWRDNPDERGHFTTLEKRVLTALPYELKAATDWQPISRDQLYFEKGDIITVFDTKGSMKRCQNRRSLQIGYLPFAFIDMTAGTIGDPDLGKTNSLPARQTAWYTEDRSESPSCESHPIGQFTPAIHFQAPHSAGCTCCHNKSKTLPIRDNKIQGNNFYADFNSPSDPRKNKNRLSLCDSVRSRGDSCNSRLSWDSGYNCRSSSYYSSDSSQHYSDGSTHYQPQSPQSPVSTPINIPGRNETRRESENIYYMNHDSPCSPCEPGSSPLSSALEDNFETDNCLYDEPIGVPCFKQSDSTLNNVPISEQSDIGKRRSLPDIVNPRRKLDVYQRQRSLQRSRRKSAKAFANSAYLIPDTPSPPHSCFQRSSSERYVTQKHFDDGELLVYDRVPTRRDLKQDFHHGNCSPHNDSIHEEGALENYDVVPSHMSKNEIGFETREMYDVVPSRDENDKESILVLEEFKSQCEIGKNENYDNMPCQKKNENEEQCCGPAYHPKRREIGEGPVENYDTVPCHVKNEKEELNNTCFPPALLPRKNENKNKLNDNQKRFSTGNQNVLLTGQSKTSRGLSLTFGVDDDERENYENSFVLMHHTEKLGSCCSIGERPKREKPARPHSEIYSKAKETGKLDAIHHRKSTAATPSSTGSSLASLLTLSPSSTSTSSLPEFYSVKHENIILGNVSAVLSKPVAVSSSPTQGNITTVSIPSQTKDDGHSSVLETLETMSSPTETSCIPTQSNDTALFPPFISSIPSQSTDKYLPSEPDIISNYDHSFVPSLPEKTMRSSEVSSFPKQSNNITTSMPSIPSPSTEIPFFEQRQKNASYYVNAPLLTSLRALIPPHRSLFGSDQWNCSSASQNLLSNFGNTPTSQMSRSYSPIPYNYTADQRHEITSSNTSQSTSIDFEDSPPLTSEYLTAEHHFRNRSLSLIGDDENNTNMRDRDKDLNRRPSLPPRLKKNAIKKLSLRDCRTPEAAVKQCIILDGSLYKNGENSVDAMDERP